ncbi:MAG: hypothetical protein H7A25_11485 [Leptospiraceae bacterium]|nr:hypothetical protein [Leptospiraceae bacterium]MCP5500518.1 hypothetical protein [Leptospiraceae bacterium]
MKKLLILISLLILGSFSGACRYSTITSTPEGKVYITKNIMMGIVTQSYECTPEGGKLNCKPLSFSK